MAFIALTLGLLVLLFLIMVVLARAFEGHCVADLLDWKPARSYELEAQLEVQDVEQMIDAQNELRRKRGAKEITEEDVQRQAREDEAIRARGRGPFAQGEGLDHAEEAPPPPARTKGAKPRRSSKPRSTGPKS